jgi:RimJ/RimL family protein N-acetyltransferase
MRLYGLVSEPGVFFSAHAQEVLLDAEWWRTWVANPAQCVFGLFHDGELVGITAVYTHRDDPSGRTALFGSTFIHPAHRGHGLSRLLYQARLDWVRARPTFGRVVVSHRRSNLPSMRAIRRFGFTVTDARTHQWPDGTTEDDVLYELDLTRQELVVRESPTVEPPWVDVPNVALATGDVHAHLLVERSGVPYRRFELRGVGRWEAWVQSDAIAWKGLLVIGFAQRAYVLSEAGGPPRQIDLESYFSGFYAGPEWLLIVSGSDVVRLDERGDVGWRSEPIGIDGIIVESVADGTIAGQYAYDPPDGWSPFALALDDGRKLDSPR